MLVPLIRAAKWVTRSVGGVLKPVVVEQGHAADCTCCGPGQCPLPSVPITPDPMSPEYCLYKDPAGDLNDIANFRRAPNGYLFTFAGINVNTDCCNNVDGAGRPRPSWKGKTAGTFAASFLLTYGMANQTDPVGTTHSNSFPSSAPHALFYEQSNFVACVNSDGSAPSESAPAVPSYSVDLRLYWDGVQPNSTIIWADVSTITLASGRMSLFRCLGDYCCDQVKTYNNWITACNCTGAMVMPPIAVARGLPPGFGIANPSCSYPYGYGGTVTVRPV